MISNPASTGEAGIITSTRAFNAAAGDVAYTGLGFTPDLVICICANQASGYSFSVGISDGTNELCAFLLNENETVLAGLCGGGNSGGYGQTAVVKSFDSDGLTLTWSQLSNPSATVGDLLFLCFRF